MDPKEEYVLCTLKIKQVSMGNQYGYNNYEARMRAQQEAHEKAIKSFYSVVNAVVDAGGVILVEKQNLDSEYRLVTPLLNIRASRSAIEKLAKHSLIESHTIH